MANGMEIFNEDFLDDFDDLDKKFLLDDNTDVDDDNTDVDEKTKKPVSKKADNDVIDEDEPEDVDDGKLDLVLPSEKSDKDKTQNSSTLNPKFFSSLTKALKEGGIIEDVNDEDIKSQEDFLKVLDDSIKAREFADLDEKQKEYLEALRDGVPHEDIADYQRQIEAYESITDEVIAEESEDGSELRRTIIMNNFIGKGISEAKAKKLTDKIFDAGEDIDEAKESLNELKKAEKEQFEANKRALAEQKAASAKAEKEAMDKLNKIVKDTKELIPGLQIPQTLKNNIVKGLTQPVAFTKEKQPLDIISKYLYENPIEGRFKLAYILSVTDGLTKMGVLENKKAKSNAFKDLENAMKTSDNGGAVDFNDGDDNTEKFDWSKWEVQ